MASKFASEVLGRLQPIGDDMPDSEVTAVVDALLDRVRKVLEGQRTLLEIDCWCHPYRSQVHTSACLAAQELMESLKVSV